MFNHIFQIEYLISSVRNLTRVIFENSGHFPRMEEPENYADTISSFFAGKRRRSI